MTNEQLAEFIKEGGNDELIPVLWEKTKPIIYKEAKSYYYYYKTLFEKSGMELWDLKQTCYVEFASKLVNRYNSESNYKFVTYIRLFVVEVGDKLIKKGRASSKNYCLSLNLPKEDDGDSELIDFIKDENECFAEKIEYKNESEIIWNIVGELEKIKKTIIIEHYKNNRTFEEIAEIVALSKTKAHRIAQETLNELKNNKILQEIAKINYNMDINLSDEKKDKIEDKINSSSLLKAYKEYLKSKNNI